MVSDYDNPNAASSSIYESNDVVTSSRNAVSPAGNSFLPDLKIDELVVGTPGVHESGPSQF